MRFYSNYSDQDLIFLMKRNDKKAFHVIYLRFWKKLFELGVQKVEDPMDAENLVQDVFVSLWNRREELEIKSSVQNYLVISLKYQVIKYYDKQRSIRLYQQNHLAKKELLDDSTQQYLDFEELKFQLNCLLNELPARSVLVYRLSKEQGWSHKEISTELGMTEKAVNALLVRVKKQLKTRLSSFLGVFL